MGRHASGRNNFALSTWVIVTIVVILALVAGYIFWSKARDNAGAEKTEAASQCIEGDLIVPVAESSPGVAGTLLASWAESAPIVRDHCIKPTIVNDARDAVLLLTTAIEAQVPAQLRELDLSSPDSPDGATPNALPVVGAIPVGLATPGDSGEPDESAAVFPVASEAAVAARVAQAIAPEQAKSLLERDKNLSTTEALAGQAPVAMVEAQTPAGWSFHPIEGATTALRAVTLSPRANAAADNQTRAAAEFKKWASEQPVGDVDNSLITVALPDLSQGQPTTLAKRQPETTRDTLILLDTSDAMAPWLDPVRGALHPMIDALGAQGVRVGLWNYSSPLSPTAQKGWRDNVRLGDAADVHPVLDGFGTGGVPQTRNSLLAAVGSMAVQAQPGNPVRIVLITTGTADDAAVSAESLSSTLASVRGLVQLSLIHLGDNPIDPAVDAVSMFTINVKDPGELAGALNQASAL